LICYARLHRFALPHYVPVTFALIYVAFAVAPRTIARCITTVAFTHHGYTLRYIHRLLVPLRCCYVYVTVAFPFYVVVAVTHCRLRLRCSVPFDCVCCYAHVCLIAARLLPLLLHARTRVLLAIPVYCSHCWSDVYHYITTCITYGDFIYVVLHLLVLLLLVHCWRYLLHLLLLCCCCYTCCSLLPCYCCCYSVVVTLLLLLLLLFILVANLMVIIVIVIYCRFTRFYPRLPHFMPRSPALRYIRLRSTHHTHVAVVPFCSYALHVWILIYTFVYRPPLPRV